MTSFSYPTSSPDLSDRVAVVTGASSGIGAASARRLAAGGATVALLARRSNRIIALANEIGGTAFSTDVTDRAQLEATATEIRQRLGRPDLVVANAGAMLAGAFEDADIDEWDRMIDVNLRGVLYTGRSFVKDLLEAAASGGSADLIHVGSIAGEMAYPAYGVYNATKGAVHRLTANLRAELGPRGVRVHTIQPGLVATELGDDMRDTDQQDALRQMLGSIRSLDAADVAEAIAYAAGAPPHVILADMVIVATQQG